MRKLRAIVFDLDDTLYPEQDYVYSGFQAVALWVEARLGICQDAVLEGLWRLFSEGKRGNIFDLWLSSLGIAPEPWVSQMIEVYRGHWPRISPYPDVLDLLPRLRQRYRLGLVTDGYVNVQRKKLEALGLTSYFDAIVFSDTLGKDAWKPSTIPFMAVLQQLGTSGPEAVYVADNPLKDFWGARLVGMWTIRVRRPEGLYSHLSPPSPEYASDKEILSLDELPEIVIQIEKSILKR